jgi:hypothetical protein
MIAAITRVAMEGPCVNISLMVGVLSHNTGCSCGTSSAQAPLVGCGLACPVRNPG